MTRFLVAPNDFKGSLSAAQAARAMARGIRAGLPGSDCELLPLADGGPGTLHALRQALGGRPRLSPVLNSLGNKTRARWLEIGPGLAFIESAEAVGLKHGKDPLRAHSFGLGQLLLAANTAGMRQVWVGLGGSATSDGGSGMARALGWRFLDAKGLELGAGGAALAGLARVEKPRSRLGLKVKVLCDVDNPLLGPRGAAKVYSPQKGASPAQVRRLEAGLRRLAAFLPKGLSTRPGAGAAGGLGAGLMAFAGARLVPGAAEILKLSRFQARLRRCDAVITGEGRLDSQSLRGKLPWSVAMAAMAAGRPCVIVCGKAVGRFKGVEVIELAGRGMPKQAAMKRAAELIELRLRNWAAALVY